MQSPGVFSVDVVPPLKEREHKMKRTYLNNYYDNGTYGNENLFIHCNYFDIC